MPDPSANPYLAFSAMLMAGLDGIRNKIEPPEPIDKDLYDLPPEEFENVKQVPGSLAEVLDALEAGQRVPAGGWRVHARPDRDVGVLETGGTRSTRSGYAPLRTSSRCTTTASRFTPADLRERQAPPPIVRTESAA